MSKWIRVAAAALSCVMIGALFSGCADKKAQKEEKTGLVNVRSEMYDAQYWASKYKNSSRILLSKEDIGKFNAQTIQSTLGMEDISYYQTSVNSTQLGSYIQEYVMPEGTLYSAQGEILYQMPEVTVDEDGNPVTGEDDSSYKDAILANRALDVMPSSNTVNYALALTNSSIRRFPTQDSVFADEADRSEDLFRVASLRIGEPMVVLYTSADALWYFIQTRNCRGWVHWNDVVLVEKSEWLNFLHAESFLVVTGAALTLPAQTFGAAPLTLSMGTVLPLYEQESAVVNGQSSDGNYIVKVPAKDSFGNFTYRLMLIPLTADVSWGYLAYTPENILKTAFQLAGQKLNPAGINGGWDANSFISSVFACFGIYLPLDFDAQRQIAADDTDLSLSSVKDIAGALDSAAPGTLLYTDIGAAFYLGREDGHYYVLQPAQDFFVGETRYSANSILITDMDILYENGSTYLNAIRLIKKLALVNAEEQ